MWTDSHCHIQDHYLDGGDPSGTLRRARAAGVGCLVCVGTDPGTSAAAVALALCAPDDPEAGEQPVELWATVGLHPHDAARGTGELAAALDALSAAESDVVVAIGECGLDYHYDHSPRDDQRRAFADQIGFANERGLTLVVHTREAWDDTIGILASEGTPERTIIHCFTGGPHEAARCLDLGAYLSFSGIVTFSGAPEVREAAAACPADRILVETDAPFLAPVPHRGKRNEPAWVTHVGAAVAHARSADVDEIEAVTTANARRAFRLPPP